MFTYEKTRMLYVDISKILFGCLLPLSNFYLINFRFADRSVLINFYLTIVGIFLIFVFINFIWFNALNKFNVVNLLIFNYIYSFLYSDFFKNRVSIYITIQILLNLGILLKSTNLNVDYLLIILFLVFNIYNFYVYYEESSQNGSFATYSDEVNIYNDSSIILNKTPNLYFVVLDGYINQNLLYEYFNIENSVVDYLTKRNYFVAQNGKSFSNMTKWSMSSLLSLKNTEEITMRPFPEKDGEGNSLVHSIFLSNNYQFLTGRSAFGNYCNESLISKFETCVYTEETNYLTKRALIDTTIFGYYQDIDMFFIDKLIDLYYNRSNLGSKGFLFSDIESRIENIERENPIFSFIHMTYTHPPYTLDSKCKLKTNWTEYKQENWNDLTAYIEGIDCTNLMIYELINFIEEKDPNAVFVVTSDHGPGIDLDGDETSFNYEEKLLATTIFFSSNLNKFCDINLDSSYYLQNFFIDFFNCFGNIQLENLEEKIIFYDYFTNKFEKISS